MKSKLKNLPILLWTKSLFSKNQCSLNNIFYSAVNRYLQKNNSNIINRKVGSRQGNFLMQMNCIARLSSCHNFIVSKSFNLLNDQCEKCENAQNNNADCDRRKSTLSLHTMYGHNCLNVKSTFNLNHPSCLLSPHKCHHQKDFVQYFKSATKEAPSPTSLNNQKSSPSRPAHPKPQSLRRLLSLAAPERWTLASGIALLSVSSAVTMSVPFIIGTLIDTIYSGGGSGTSSGFLSIAESFNNSPTATDSIATDVLPQSSPNPSSEIPGAEILASNDASLPATSTGSSPGTNLEKVCAALAGIFIMGGLANCGRVYLMTTAGQRISQTLRSKVFSSLLRQETAFFDRHGTGELLSRLAADTPLVSHAVTSNVADGVRSAVMTVAAVSMMVYTSPELSLFGLSVVPLVALLATYHGRRLRATAAAVQEKLASCTQHAEERLSNVRTVRLFAQESREMAAQDELLKGALALMYREAKMRSIFFGLTGLTGNMIVLSVLYKGSSLVGSGLLSVGSLSAFLMYAAYVGISVSGLTSAYSELSKGAGAADRLFELIDRTPLMPLHGGDLVSTESLSGSVEFRNVHFNYPSRPHANVFNGLQLSVPAGRVVSVVGASGCGKSSVLALLLRLYDPTSGSVCVDGRDIRSLDPASLRAAIGVVSQDPVLFSGTIRHNLLYGSPDPAAVTQLQLEEAAQQANALEFITKFPKGLDTVVGERGVLLSGGQRQRLAIARAIVSQPRILCLDEATSALDSESEHLVQEAIERIMRGRTVITIAHRLSTIRTADDIAVLEGGRVVELGSFSDLMSRPDGAFRKLVIRQTGGDLNDTSDR